MRAERGLVFADRYELVELLAIGGMGEVWRAEDRVLGRDVAVKVLKPEYAADAGFLARFRGEARHAAALSHPGIAMVFDYGEQDGRAFLVMELVVGEPLAATLARSGPMRPEAAADLLVQVADALAVAHRAGIIHRDVKPGNVMVTPEGRVKLTDFGIAKALGSIALTASGVVVGTAQYISPEQATGAVVSPASDVYALGVVAYEVLTGRPPFIGDNQVAIARAHVHDAPPPLPPTVPRPLAALVRDSLAKQPSDRPRDASVFAERLRAMRNTPTVAAGAPAPTTRMPTTQPASAAVASGALGPATRLDIGNPAASHRGRRRMVGVAVGVILVALAVAGALAAVAALDDGDAAESGATVPPVTTLPTAATTIVAATTTPATIAPTTAAPTTTLPPTTLLPTVTIDASDLEGRRADEVEQELRDAGLLVTVTYVEVEGRLRDRVVAVDPEGNLPVGSEITVTVGSRPDRGGGPGPAPPTGPEG